MQEILAKAARPLQKVPGTSWGQIWVLAPGAENFTFSTAAPSPALTCVQFPLPQGCHGIVPGHQGARCNVQPFVVTIVLGRFGERPGFCSRHLGGTAFCFTKLCRQKFSVLHRCNLWVCPSLGPRHARAPMTTGDSHPWDQTTVGHGKMMAFTALHSLGCNFPVGAGLWKTQRSKFHVSKPQGTTFCMCAWFPWV